MTEPVTIELFLECFQCGTALEGEIDTDQRILVKRCERCMDNSYHRGYRECDKGHQ